MEPARGVADRAQRLSSSMGLVRGKDTREAFQMKVEVRIVKNVVDLVEITIESS